MTKLSKLTALLLAGVLTLLLLTACSGGGSSGPVAQAEADVMGAINNGRTVALSNDPDMREVAAAHLDAKLKGNFRGYTGYHEVKYDEKTSTLTLIAQYDYKDTTLEKLIGYITENNEASNLKFNLSSNWAKVGRSSRNLSGEDLHRHHSTGKEDLTCPFSPINADHPPVGG